MSNFGTDLLSFVNGKYDFYQLTVDGIGQLDQFELEIEEVYKSELTTIKAYMDFVAMCVPLPDTKFKPLRGYSHGIKEYEFKSKHLRLYAIQLSPYGKIIILGGTKAKQDDDIKLFRGLKEKFLTAINYGK